MHALPDEVRELLTGGRDAYLRQDFVEALRLDEQALALACQGDDRYAQAVCYRFVGLCHYRRASAESLARSEAHFREAIAIARSLGDTCLRLVVSNHLGATLRDLGRHDEGYDLFREALREAVGPDLAAVRARLLGNLGALLDELKQRASADDCYARYEELLERGTDTRRLANARGLAGRAALLRGDLDEAAWRFEEELRRGEEAKDLRRCTSALRHRAHLAMVRLERARGADAEEGVRRTREAEAAFEAARVAAERSGDSKDRIRIALRHVEFLRAQGRTAEAHCALSDVRPLADELDHPVLTPKVDQASAHVCADAGLHGESLWYLFRAARRRITVIRALKSPRVREMARAWLDEVRAMANELREEAFRVPRGDSERQEFAALIAEINNALGGDARAVPSQPIESAWQWHDQLRTRSKERWKAILGDDFARLHADSREDLVRADVTYHGAVDDLGRSAHLLVLTLERELRERLLVPFRKVAHDLPNELRKGTDWRPIRSPTAHPSLRELLAMIEMAGAPHVRARFEGELGRAAFEALIPLARTMLDVSTQRGEKLDIVDIRNAIAHGRPGASLDRVSVDAIKRTLTLDAPVVLKGLLVWPLIGEPT